MQEAYRIYNIKYLYTFMCICCFHYNTQLAQYAVVDYFKKVFTQFVLLDSGKFNTTVVIARVIQRRAKEKLITFVLSQCCLRLVCDFRIPRIFTVADTVSRPVTFPIRTLQLPTIQFIVSSFFFFCKCRNVQEECPLLLDILTIEDEAAALL